MVISDRIMTMLRKPRILAAAEFKAKCLGLLDDVARNRTTLVVTKWGKPVAQVVPLPEGQRQSLRGSLLFEEDPFAPVDAEWESLS